jgi:hypothetical protein
LLNRKQKTGNQKTGEKKTGNKKIARSLRPDREAYREKQENRKQKNRK